MIARLKDWHIIFEGSVAGVLWWAVLDRWGDLSTNWLTFGLLALGAFSATFLFIFRCLTEDYE